MSTVVPTLETERLILRDWRREDEGPCVEMFVNDPGMEFVGGPNTPTDAWRRVAGMIGHWRLRGFGRFAIEEKSSGTWVGCSGVWCPPEFPEPDLGWVVRAHVRGRGYAREAAARIRAHAFEHWGFTSLASFIAADNIASQRVAMALGAVRDGNADLYGKPVDVWRHLPSAAEMSR